MRMKYFTLMENVAFAEQFEVTGKARTANAITSRNRNNALLW